MNLFASLCGTSLQKNNYSSIPDGASTIPSQISITRDDTNNATNYRHVARKTTQDIKARVLKAHQEFSSKDHSNSVFKNLESRKAIVTILILTTSFLGTIWDLFTFHPFSETVCQFYIFLAGFLLLISEVSNATTNNNEATEQQNPLILRFLNCFLTQRQRQQERLFVLHDILAHSCKFLMTNQGKAIFYILIGFFQSTQGSSFSLGNNFFGLVLSLDSISGGIAMFVGCLILRDTKSAVTKLTMYYTSKLNSSEGFLFDAINSIQNNINNNNKMLPNPATYSDFIKLCTSSSSSEDGTENNTEENNTEKALLLTPIEAQIAFQFIDTDQDGLIHPEDIDRLLHYFNDSTIGTQQSIAHFFFASS